MIQEVTTGTTRVFSSVFDGIDNTVKVSVFMIGAFLVSMLGSWLQSAAWLCCARRNAASGPHQLAEVAASSPTTSVAELRYNAQVNVSEAQADTKALALTDAEAASAERTSLTEPSGFLNLGPGGPETGKISGLSLELMSRAIWLRAEDGYTIRKGWSDELENLLVPGTVRIGRSHWHRERGSAPYRQHVFYVNAAHRESKNTFTVTMSGAIEDLSRSADLGRVALRGLISCTCTQYSLCKKSIPGDLADQWPGIERDVLCKHCIVVLLCKLIAQTYPGVDYREAMTRWKQERKNWPLTPGERELGNESRDVYITSEGLKIGPRKNYNSDFYKAQSSKPKTFYVTLDPYEWIRELPFPDEAELAGTTACFSALKVKASMGRGRREGGAKWFDDDLARVLAMIERETTASPIYALTRSVDDIMEIAEPKQLLRDVSTGLVVGGKANDVSTIRGNTWIQGQYKSVTLRRYQAVDASEEIVTSIECHGSTAALIGREQALAEREAVVLCCYEEEPTTRCVDIITTLLVLLEKKVRIILVLSQGLMRQEIDLTNFVIKLREAKTVAVMITPEKFQSQVFCLGLKVRITSEELLDDIDRVGYDQRGYNRWPTPTPLFRETMSLRGQTQAAERGGSIGSVSISRGLPIGLVSWFEKLMTRSLPLADWMMIVDDRRDTMVDFSQRHSLSLARSRR